MNRKNGLRSGAMQSIGRIFETPDKSRAASLFESFRLARLAGKAIAPVLQNMHLNVSFYSGANCRVEDDTLVLLVNAPSQENRLRQMTTRLTAALIRAELPLNGVKIRIVSRDHERAAPEPARVERESSLLGAISLAENIELIESPPLRSVLTSLKSRLSPVSSDNPLFVVSRLNVLIKDYEEMKERLEEELRRIDSLIEESRPLEPRFIYTATTARHNMEQHARHEQLKAHRDEVNSRLITVGLLLPSLAELLEIASLEPEFVGETLDEYRPAAHFAPPPFEFHYHPDSPAGADALTKILPGIETPELRRALSRLASNLSPADHEERLVRLEYKLQELRFSLALSPAELARLEAIPGEVRRGALTYEEAVAAVADIERRRRPGETVNTDAPAEEESTRPEKNLVGSSFLRHVDEGTSPALKAALLALSEAVKPAEATPFEAAMERIGWIERRLREAGAAAKLEVQRHDVSYFGEEAINEREDALKEAFLARSASIEALLATLTEERDALLKGGDPDEILGELDELEAALDALTSGDDAARSVEGEASGAPASADAGTKEKEEETASGNRTAPAPRDPQRLIDLMFSAPPATRDELFPDNDKGSGSATETAPSGESGVVHSDEAARRVLETSEKIESEALRNKLRELAGKLGTHR